MSWSSLILPSILAAAALALAGVLAAVRFGPLGGRWWMPRLCLADGRFGALSSSRLALQFVVDADGGGAMAGAGRLASRALFPAARFPRFTVRTFSAFARPSLLRRRGGWADPAAPLYNLRFGVWEVEAEAALWRQPFAYRDDGSVDAGTLVRPIKADCNYFACFAWGVPLDRVAAGDELDGAAVHATPAERALLGGRAWDHLRLDGIDVASPGRGGGDHREPEATDAVVGGLWRLALGVGPRTAAGPSFAPMRLRARLHLSHSKRDDADRGRLFCTTIVGAFARDGDPEAEAVLDAQVESLEGAIGAFDDIGFPPTPGAVPSVRLAP